MVKPTTEEQNAKIMPAENRHKPTGQEREDELRAAVAQGVIRVEPLTPPAKPQSNLAVGQDKAKKAGNRREAGLKAGKTRRIRAAWAKAHIAEAASKEALRTHCEKNGWRLAFFEGKTGSPRTGIVDAIAFRIDRHNADLLDFRLIQLKGGKAGVTGKEIARLKKAASSATVNWMIVCFDGEALQFLPDELE